MLMVNKEAQQNRTRTASPTAIPYSKHSHKNWNQQQKMLLLQIFVQFCELVVTLL
mgnify:CR=1 FL=1